jgi:tetratricopeptide (TPR) repeat protein
MTMIAFWLALALSAAQAAHDMRADDRPATLVEGLGSTHHAIATKSEEAQKFFDQGLTFVYAFNHDEAVRSFRKAAELDPASPMPLWGVALALGPNINLDVDPEREKEAFETVQRALKLTTGAPPLERAYVEALVKRYSDNPKADLKALAVQYKNAMAALVKQYPDDLDAATLYAESMMDLRPWQLWSNDGTPAEGTLDIVDVLEGVIRRDANHVGANHYYIHAVEASFSPDRGLASAKKLETLVPAAGHLVHMPAHIYMRTGDYAAAVKANANAADVDRKYIADTKADGIYPAMYYNHNLDFLASAAMMNGQFAEAAKAADEVVKNVSAILNDMPMVEPFAAKKTWVLLRFAKWDEVLAEPIPDPKFKILTVISHFGRTVALAKKGSRAEAIKERQAYNAAKKALPPDTPWLYNTSGKMFAVMDAVLDARLAPDINAAIFAFRKAVAAEDLLNYDEPADWYYPVRESLGAALFKAKLTEQARSVFRDDLEHNPNNGRSLFGLYQVFRTYSKDDPDTLVTGRSFSDAWEHADVQLNIDDY